MCLYSQCYEGRHKELPRTHWPTHLPKSLRSKRNERICLNIWWQKIEEVTEVGFWHPPTLMCTCTYHKDIELDSTHCNQACLNHSHCWESVQHARSVCVCSLDSFAIDGNVCFEWFQGSLVLNLTSNDKEHEQMPKHGHERTTVQFNRILEFWI